LNYLISVVGEYALLLDKETYKNIGMFEVLVQDKVYLIYEGAFIE